MVEIFDQWQEWRDHGMVPGREVGGRGAQNPILLAAFSRFRSLEAQARKPKQ